MVPWLGSELAKDAYVGFFYADQSRPADRVHAAGNDGNPIQASLCMNDHRHDRMSSASIGFLSQQLAGVVASTPDR
jgi:hypothetical protein